MHRVCNGNICPTIDATLSGRHAALVPVHAFVCQAGVRRASSAASPAHTPTTACSRQQHSSTPRASPPHTPMPERQYTHQIHTSSGKAQLPPQGNQTFRLRVRNASRKFLTCSEPKYSVCACRKNSANGNYGRSTRKYDHRDLIAGCVYHPLGVCITPWMTGLCIQTGARPLTCHHTLTHSLTHSLTPPSLVPALHNRF